MNNAVQNEQDDVVPAYGGCFVRRGNDLKFVPGENMLPLPVILDDNSLGNAGIGTSEVEYDKITREISTS